MDILDIKRTMTTIFMLPLLYPGITYKDLPEDFLNCYLTNTDLTYSEYYIYLQFVDNGFSLPIPEENETDYKLFVQGKYSKLSLGTKQDIIKFWMEYDDSLLYSILFNTEKAHKYIEDKYGKPGQKYSKTKEAWPKPNLIKETFNTEENVEYT